jgi:murein DD-endopeptidase MepM/ murein hydrolase activator NlpD
VPNRTVSFFVLAVWIADLWLLLVWSQRPPNAARSNEQSVPYPAYFSKYILPALPVAKHFDAPVRPPDGAGVSIALGFGEENHLGEDWNTAKGNGDLNEPVYAIADGWVTLAVDFQAYWGNVVMIAHRLPPNDPSKLEAVESMYAHMNTITVKPWTFVKRGQQIGTIGNANGVYKAHLHWELRDSVGEGLGGGFSERTDGWLNPSAFISAHRTPPTPLKTRKLPANQRNAWGFDG